MVKDTLFEKRLRVRSDGKFIDIYLFQCLYFCKENTPQEDDGTAELDDEAQ